MHIEVNPIKLIALMLLFMLLPAVLLFAIPFANTGISPENINYMLMDKSRLNIYIETVSPDIRKLAADPDNSLVIRVKVKDSSGASIPGAGVKLEVSGPIGSFQPAEGYTDEHGSFLSVYTPPAAVTGTLRNIANGTDDIDNTGSINFNSDSSAGNKPASKVSETIRLISRLSGTDKYSSLQIDLVSVPVVLIHGYQASPEIFSGLSQYLKLQGYTPLSFKYASEKGVASSSEELSAFLRKKTAELEASGLQTGRFDLIGHSMGGLVARYYTCSGGYNELSNVRKIIFISVPQKGSPLAPLGLQLYKDSGINDLIPEGDLYTAILPSMTNGGLNPSIQTGSILGSHDEVVGTESASLSDWGIETELFNVGDSNFTVDKLLSGELLQAANHKMILYNKKVYQRVQQMLESGMPYPAVK